MAPTRYDRPYERPGAVTAGAGADRAGDPLRRDVRLLGEILGYCALFLLDRSKPNTARWCSMAVCGNRMKARRHYERARAGR